MMTFQSIIALTSLLLGAPVNLNINANEWLQPAVSNLNEVSVDGWIAYQTVAIGNLGMPCCWDSWNGSDRGESGCRLDRKPMNMGSHDGNGTADTEAILIFALLDGSKTERLLAVGDQCPVDLGDMPLTWLGDISNDASAQWLAASVENSERSVRSGAIHALSMHLEGDIESRLSVFAKTGSRQTAQDAIFWLGKARGSAGFTALGSLLGELPAGRTRRQINFALGQNDTPQASRLLASIARNDTDTKQRADALFWLANSYPSIAVGEIDRVLQSSNARSVWESALHGLAEIDSDAARDTLIASAQSHEDSRVRGQAMFWLAQGYPDSARAFLLSRLQNPELKSVADREVEAAVFALSQLPSPHAAESLIQVIRSMQSNKTARRKALFWLSQSDDPRATDALVSLLEH